MYVQFAILKRIYLETQIWEIGYKTIVYKKKSLIKTNTGKL